MSGKHDATNMGGSSGENSQYFIVFLFMVLLSLIGSRGYHVRILTQQRKVPLTAGEANSYLFDIAD
jgi:hypothetical protein